MKPKNILAALLSGVCLVLIFPKARLAGLAWFALVPLLFTIKDSPPPKAFRLGFITGLAYFLGTLYWIPHTLTQYGKLPGLLSWGILSILVTFLALYVGGFAWGITWCGNLSPNREFFHGIKDGLFAPLIKGGSDQRERRGMIPFKGNPPGIGWGASPLLIAAWWVSLEYLRTYLLTGFPWVLLGYSQVSHLPMIQVAEFTGVYGISFLIVLVNATIADFLSSYLEKRKLPWRFSGAVLALVLVCFAYGHWQLSLESPAASLKVAVVQGNIAQDQKWDPKYQEEVFRTYRDLTLQAARNGKPQLLIWPEAATPFYFQSDRTYRPQLLELTKGLGIPLLFGSPGYKQVNRKLRPFNAAYLVSAQGEELGNYQKIHLVPFGEYVPLEQIFAFTGKLVAQAGNFVCGHEYSLLPLGSTPLGTVICYEIIFPDLVRRFVKRGAEVLVNITNDAWFGKTAAPYQHFDMLALRAVENRRYIVRAANSGISGFVDPWGRVLKQGGLFNREYLIQKIAPQTKISFYSSWGDLLPILCSVLVIIGLVVSYQCKRKGDNICKKS